MITTFRKSGQFAAGLLLALLSGAPALADDTELLLVNPDDLAAPKPNIMFILDTSGSMTTLESTREIYDSTLTFTGTCNPDALYWSEVDVRPSCDAANTRYIEKASFVCDSARLQLDGIGSYTNTMAQFRDGGSGWFSTFLGLDQERWQQLEAGNTTGLVECRVDRGLHGGADAARVYAQKGGDPVDPFTDDVDEEVSWGSWPASQTITVFDGNYLNYVQNPVTVNESRINIVRNVTKAVLNSVSNINVGIMRFNNDRGGPVILGLTDLDSNRALINSKIDSMNAAGATPLSETLYESALYWRGLPAYYGERVNEHPTDPKALVSTNPEVYRQPSSDSCSKNFNVLLTDGEPNNDLETPSLVGALPAMVSDTGPHRLHRHRPGRLPRRRRRIPLHRRHFGDRGRHAGRHDAHHRFFDQPADPATDRGSLRRPVLPRGRCREPDACTAQDRGQHFRSLDVVRGASGSSQHLQPHAKPE